jgi:hypothetical protein
MTKNILISIISDIIIKEGLNWALNIDLSIDEIIKKINPIPIINPFAWERSFILYMNKNIITIPNIVPKTNIGNKVRINTRLGPNIINIDIKLKNVSIIPNLNLFDCFGLILFTFSLI